jgi:hypothetical protein
MNADLFNRDFILWTAVKEPQQSWNRPQRGRMFIAIRNNKAPDPGGGTYLKQRAQQQWKSTSERSYVYRNANHQSIQKGIHL